MIPLIKDCACGKDHMTMPTDIDEFGEYDLVCIKHKRHEPCRPCLREEGVYDKSGRVKREFL